MSEEVYLSFVVYGRTVAAVRTTRRQKFTDPYYARYRDYKEYFSTIAKQALQKHPHLYFDKGIPIEYRSVVYLKGRRRIDLDNIIKSHWDALTSVIWHDDSQVVKAEISKVTVETEKEERVEVRVKRFEPKSS